MQRAHLQYCMCFQGSHFINLVLVLVLVLVPVAPPRTSTRQVRSQLLAPAAAGTERVGRNVAQHTGD